MPVGEDDVEPACGGVQRDAGAGDPGPDDEEVDDGAVREPFQGAGAAGGG
ncbi:hypothetical protein [Streptomyces sp. NRRL S-1868]